MKARLRPPLFRCALQQRTQQLAGCGLMLTLLATGCATLSPPQVRTERRVLTSTVSTARSPGELIVRDARWRGSSLSATLEQQQLCQQNALEQVSYQTITNRKSSGLPATIALSAAGAAAGGAMFAWSTRLPTNPSSSVMSAQGAAQLGGTILLGWAVTGFVDAIKVGLDSGDTSQGPPRVVDETRPLGASSVCGIVPTSGELVFAFGDHEALRMPVDAAGHVLVDVEAERDHLCTRETDIGTPLRITWKLGDAAREVSSTNADDCIRAQVASLQLAHARELVETATGPERLVAAGPALRVADRLLGRLSTQYPRRQELMAQLSSLHEARDRRAQQLLGELLARVPQALAEGGPFALSPALDALDLATGPALQASTTATILQDLANAAASDLLGATAELDELLERRPELKVCLDRSDGCPVGTARASALGALKPLSDLLFQRLSNARRTAEGLTKALATSPDDQAARTLSASLANLKGLSSACRVVSWDPVVTGECAQLAPVIRGGELALSSAHDQGYPAP